MPLHPTGKTAAARTSLWQLPRQVNQAALQFELWTGRPAPRDMIEKVLRERLMIDELGLMSWD